MHPSQSARRPLTARKAAALTALLGVALSGVGLFGLRPQSTASAAGTTPGVLLPDGRLVTPAGSSYDPAAKTGDAAYDLGDFPLGLALSPDGRLAVASLNGDGTGTPHTFGSECDQFQGPQATPCPGVPDRLKGDAALKTPDEGLSVVDLTTGKVTQALAVPTISKVGRKSSCGDGFNCFGIGVAFSPDGKHVYATGAGGDQLFDFAVTGSTLTLAHTVAVPGLASKFPSAPAIGATSGSPRALAVTPDGKSVVVASEFDSSVSLFDLGTGGPTLAGQGLLPGAVPGQSPVGYLYGAAVSPDSQFAYVTAQGSGILYAVNLAALRGVGTVTTNLPGGLSSAPPASVVPYVLSGVDHPTGVTVSPDGSRLLVTGTNSDNLAVVPLTAGLASATPAPYPALQKSVSDALDALAAGGIPAPVVSALRSATAVGDLPTVTPTLLPLSVADRGAVKGSKPNDVAVAADGRTAYVAMAGDNAVAVVDLTAATPTVRGYVPTGWYPTAVRVGPKDGRLYTVAAKGYGSRYIGGPSDYQPPAGKTLPSGATIPDSGYYDAENMPGLLTRVTPPSAVDLTAYSTTARLDALHATGLDQRPADSPIPAKLGDPSPIKNIVYIVRENRTFDQVFGDLPLARKDADGDPSLQLLAAATPNAHSVANRFAIGDHFFSNGEASIQGHWWTSSADTNDYVEKSWRQYYSPRNRPYDPAIGPATSPPGCSIFQAAQKKIAADPSFTAMNFGELVGADNPSTSLGIPTANLCGGGLAAGPMTIPSDPNYPNQLTLTPDDRGRAAEFLSQSGLTADGKDAGNGRSLRNFNYLIMSEDHTSGLSGTNTPRSQVAQNDAAVGQVISALSKSKYWPSTAVMVTEDDSQDGTDHVDGHRNVLLVASPWTRQTSGDGCVPGYIGHSHYDQGSVLRTLELILGIPPLSITDAVAPPLYDLFTDKSKGLTADELKPYEVAPPPPFIDEQVADIPKNGATAALKAYSDTLDTVHLDRSEAGVEAVLWQSLRTDPMPAQLAAKVDAASGSAPKGSTAAGSTAAGSTAAAEDAAAVQPDQQPAAGPTQVRPGVAPTISTKTGLPLAAGQGCQASAVAAPAASSSADPVGPAPAGASVAPTTGPATASPASASPTSSSVTGAASAAAVAPGQTAPPGQPAPAASASRLPRTGLPGSTLAAGVLLLLAAAGLARAGRGRRRTG